MDEKAKEVLAILLVGIVLGLSVSYGKEPIDYLITIVSFLVIIFVNVTVKNTTAYHYEADIDIKPWSIYQYGLERRHHFKKPVPMIWLPIVLSMITAAKFWWLAALQFDARPRPERVVKRHRSRYRFTQMTEEHTGYIALSGIGINLLIGLISLIFGFVDFARLNVYFAAWSLVPISNLDGSKVLFGSKVLWILSVVITIVMFIAVNQ